MDPQMVQALLLEMKICKILKNSPDWKVLINDAEMRFCSEETDIPGLAKKYLDAQAMRWDIEEVKKIVITFGVLEIMERIEDEYGEQEITNIKKLDLDMKYRVLMFHILLPFFIEEIEEIYKLEGYDTEEHESSDEEDEEDEDEEN